jgi:hypothetical protein
MSQSTTFQWTGGSADWSNGVDWNPSSVPGSDDTATIAAAGSYVVTIGTSDNESIAALTLNDAGATLAVDGELAVSGSLALTSGVLTVSGMLTARTISVGGTLDYAQSGTLGADAVTLAGVVELIGTVDGAETLTLTGTITPSGTSGAITSGGTVSSSETVINLGTIAAGASGTVLMITPGTFENQGRIAVGNGESLTIGNFPPSSGPYTPWSNSGSIGIAAGGVLTLGGGFDLASLAGISNAGLIRIEGSLDNSAGTLEIGALGTVQLVNPGTIAGGTISDPTGAFEPIQGTLQSVTYVGTLNVTGGGWLTVNGGITMLAPGGGAGTINVTAGGGYTTLNWLGSGTLDSVVINLGDATGDGYYDQIAVSGSTGDDLVLGPNAVVQSTGASANAYIQNAYENFTGVVNEGTILAHAAGGWFGFDAAGGVANSGLIDIANGDTLSMQGGNSTSNSGTIRVGADSQLTLVDAGITTFQNTGTISLDAGGTLTLHGAFSLASLGTVVNQGATVSLDGGDFINTGETLALGPGTALGSHFLVDGEITGGTIDTTGNDMTVVDATLDDVTVVGDLTLTRDYSGITFDGTADLRQADGSPGGTLTAEGTYDSVNFTAVYPQTSYTADNMTIMVGNASPYGDEITGSVTLGPSVEIIDNVTHGLAQIEAGYYGMVNQGEVIVDGSHATVTLEGYTLTNEGIITVSNDATLVGWTALRAGASAGTIELASGGLADFKEAVADTNIVQFQDATGTVQIESVGSFAGTLKGFADGDRIDLSGITYAAGNTVACNGTDLVVSNAGGTALATVALSDGSETLGAYVLQQDTTLGGTDIVDAACYAAGTRIDTERGAVAIEALRVGDRLVSAFGGTAPVVWIGHRRVDCRRHPRPQEVRPVRVRRGAFGPDRPRRDLWLSGDHAVFIAGVLIPVRYLVNGATVVRERVDTVSYFHVELPAHDVILAEGLPAESYLDTGNRGAFANGGADVRMHPDFALRIWEAEACAPLVYDGAKVEAARRLLLDRAATLGHATTRDPDLRLLAAGRELRPEVHGRTHRFHVPEVARGVRLLSRSAVPAEAWTDSTDHRRLGVALSRLVYDGRVIPLADPRLGSGWHDVERAGDDAVWRWTDGDAAAALQGGHVLDIEVALTARYWLERFSAADRTRSARAA